MAITNSVPVLPSLITELSVSPVAQLSIPTFKIRDKTS